MAAEISVAKRERDFYLSRVDKAKAGDAMRQRKQLKADKVCQGMGLGTGQHNAAIQTANHNLQITDSGALFYSGMCGLVLFRQIS